MADLEAFFDFEPASEPSEPHQHQHNDNEAPSKTIADYEKAVGVQSELATDGMDLDSFLQSSEYDWFLPSNLLTDNNEIIVAERTTAAVSFQDSFSASSASQASRSTTTPYTPGKHALTPKVSPPQGIRKEKRTKSMGHLGVSRFVDDFRAMRSYSEPQQTIPSPKEAEDEPAKKPLPHEPITEYTGLPWTPQGLPGEERVTTKEALINGNNNMPAPATETSQQVATNTEDIQQDNMSMNFDDMMDITDFLANHLNAYGSSSQEGDAFNSPSYIPTANGTTAGAEVPYVNGNSRRETDLRRRGSFSNQKRVSSSKAKKSIPPRFQRKKDNVELVESHIQCLNVLIDYGQYTGTIVNDPKVDTRLCNQVKPSTLLLEYQDCVKPAKTDLSIYSPFTAVGQRVRVERKIDEIWDSVTNIVYLESDTFSVKAPYEPQYVRFELDEEGRLVNETKCGLCPYCVNVKFLLFKNSSYLSHLTLEHGIFSTNFLIPEGYYLGEYLFDKQGTHRSNGPESKRALGHRCPICLEVVELGCWAIKANGLLSYFRHFKQRHKDLARTQNSASSAHIFVKSRGRKLIAKHPDTGQNS